VIIDTHAHAAGPYMKAENLIAAMDANNVDKTVLVPGEWQSDTTYAMPDIARAFPYKDVVSVTNRITKAVIGISGKAKHIDRGNAYVHTMACQYPKRIIQFYWARLRKAGIMDDLQHDFSAYAFKGLKLHQCWERFSVEERMFHQVADWAAAHDLPVFVHLYSKNEAACLARYITRHKSPVFIIGHLYGLEQYIQERVPDDRVLFEISTPDLVSIERLKKAVSWFGAGRIVLGSDTPYGCNTLKRNIDRVMSLPVADSEKELILGRTMKSLLGI